MMPSIVLYEYFSRNIARSSKHYVFSRLIKIEALTKLNMFTEAIATINSLERGDYIPHFIDDKPRVVHVNKHVKNFMLNFYYL
jgi:hypothetical protein